MGEPGVSSFGLDVHMGFPPRDPLFLYLARPPEDLRIEWWRNPLSVLHAIGDLDVRFPCSFQTVNAEILQVRPSPSNLFYVEQ